LSSRRNTAPREASRDHSVLNRSIPDLSPFDREIEGAFIFGDNQSGPAALNTSFVQSVP
jgi:hypothetical protein